MTTTELINKKNQIVFNVTGKMLVPVDQIVEVEAIRLEPMLHLSGSSCIYCEVFRSGCSNCPMAMAGNECIKDENNTFEVCAKLWKEKATKEDKEKLYDLIVEYNTALKM